MDVDGNEMDEVSKAYAAISSELDSWESPKLRKNPSLGSNLVYEEDAVQWMEATTLGAAEESSLLEKPETPIMNNSSNKKKQEHVSAIDFNSPVLQPVQTQSSYQLYHDSLWDYLVARSDINKSDRNTASSEADCSADLEFLSNLSFDNSLWSLLGSLRSRGLDCLFMDSSKHGANSGVPAHLNELSGHLEYTPLEIVERMYDVNAPLLLQRRKAIMQWLKFTQELQISRMECPHPSTTSDGDAPLLLPELPRRNIQKDEDLMKFCLQCLLAGRLDKAITACEQHGQLWRCASWSGGQPYDFQWVRHDESQSVVKISSGNPEWASWKTQCRKLASLKGFEGGIYILLGNDLQSGLHHSSLRSWEKGLHLGFTCLLGRLEDEILHRYYGQMRKAGKVFPGSTYLKAELEHMRETAPNASLTESSILRMLEASPFQEMSKPTLVQKIIGAFVQGKEAIFKFLRKPWANEAKDPESLRIVTHLLLFLDATTEGKDDSFPNMSSWKDEILMDYLRHLASHPNLWKYMTVYASLLPRKKLLSVYPGLLTSIVVPDERRHIYEQMNDLLRKRDDLKILKQVVRLILTNKDATDSQKFQALGWLSFSPSHEKEAMIFLNTLLRQLILAEKFTVALQFLERPHSYGIKLSYVGDANLEREYDALFLFLKAMTMFDKWKAFLESTSAKTVLATQYPKPSGGVDGEAIRSAIKYDILRAKRETCTQVAKVSNDGYSTLLEVLVFKGGWLIEDTDELDKEAEGIESEENRKRAEEIDQIHSRFIPQISFMLHDLCSSTAAWMEDMLGDSVPTLGANKRKALAVIDNSPDSPFSPLLWLRRAKALGDIVPSEENKLHLSFSRDDLRMLLDRIGAIMIREFEWLENTE